VENQDEVGAAVILLRGQRVIADVKLAEWFGVTMTELHLVIQKNNDLMDSAFVFRLDKEEKVRFACESDSLSAERRVSPTFAFTIHGIILLTACFGYSGPEIQNARMIRILTVLNSGFSAG
jgi:hypothetical protein